VNIDFEQLGLGKAHVTHVTISPETIGSPRLTGDQIVEILRSVGHGKAGAAIEAITFRQLEVSGVIMVHCASETSCGKRFCNRIERTAFAHYVLVDSRIA